jgi:hypothetical protein
MERLARILDQERFARALGRMKTSHAHALDPFYTPKRSLRTPSRGLSFLIGAVGLSFARLAHAATPSYDVTLLPSPEGTDCLAEGIDPAGTTLVGYCFATSGTPVAIPEYWKKADGAWKASQFAPKVSNPMSLVSINASGQVAGTYEQSDGTFRAFFADSVTADTVEIIPNLPDHPNCYAPSQFFSANVLTTAGEVFGTCYGTDSSPGYRGFSWTKAAGVTAIADGPNGCDNNGVTNVLADGTLLAQEDCNGDTVNYIQATTGKQTVIPNSCTGAGELLSPNVFLADGTVAGSCFTLTGPGYAVIQSANGDIDYILGHGASAEGSIVAALLSDTSAVGDRQNGGFYYVDGDVYTILNGGVNDYFNTYAANSSGQLAGVCLPPSSRSYVACLATPAK